MSVSWPVSPPLGVTATNDVDALLALKPDVVVYNPMWIDVDELVRILEAGVNVVATASFITGHNQGEGRDRIADACRRGGSTMFGSGISPPATSTSWPSWRPASATGSTRSPSTRRPTRRSTTPPPRPRCPSASAGPSTTLSCDDDRARHRGVFGEAVRMIGDALGVEFDEVRCDAEYAKTTADLDLGSWTIPAGGA